MVEAVKPKRKPRPSPFAAGQTWVPQGGLGREVLAVAPDGRVAWIWEGAILPPPLITEYSTRRAFAAWVRLRRAVLVEVACDAG